MNQSRNRSESGMVSVIAALLVSTVLLALAAVGVDTARWYLERERLQSAADAAALAGVVYMPNDFDQAVATAIDIAGRNGYVHGVDSTFVEVEPGERPSELRVTITRSIENQFGAAIGISTTDLDRTAVADFTSPAPMGSPCNTFGNQPPGQPHTLPTGFAGAPITHTTCPPLPYFWAAVEGPSTDKMQGDRYSTTSCTGTGLTGKTTFGCSNRVNLERRNDGYFFAIKIQPEAVLKPVQLQVYDPAYTHTQLDCSLLPATGSIASNSPNDFVNDAKNRYSQYKSPATSDYPNGRVTNASAQQYCSGDYNPGGSGGTAATTPPTTSFAVREQTDTNNPLKAATVTGADGRPCVSQFSPTRSVALSNLTKSNSAYNQELSRTFHQWVSTCTFTPQREGDYYLQVRTNVPTSGGAAVPNNKSNTPIEHRGNLAVTSSTGTTTNAGTGLNSFAIRAVTPNSETPLSGVSVSGWSRMPILQNVAGSTATFNLIRALPAARGQTISFDFFDAADGTGSTSGASVKVIAPSDALGTGISSSKTISGCRKQRDDEADLSGATNCTVAIRGNTHDGRVQKVLIPIPDDYTCDDTTLGGCWFRAQVSFPSTLNVTDFTTWDATVGGDPVRLIE